MVEAGAAGAGSGGFASAALAGPRAEADAGGVPGLVFRVQCSGFRAASVRRATSARLQRDWLAAAGSLVVLAFDAVARDDEVRPVSPMTEQTPVLGILTTRRVTRKRFKHKAAFKLDLEAAVHVATHIDDLGQHVSMALEPLALCRVQQRLVLVPIEVFDRDGFISWTVQVVAPEQDL